MSCALCGQPCEYVEWKLHIPSPKRKREWSEFWTRYRRDRQLIEQFRSDPNLNQVDLELLNQRLTKL